MSWWLCFAGITWRELLRFTHQRGRFFSALVRPLLLPSQTVSPRPTVLHHRLSGMNALVMHSSSANHSTPQEKAAARAREMGDEFGNE